MKTDNVLFVDLETRSGTDIDKGPTLYFADPDADWLIACALPLTGKGETVATNFDAGHHAKDALFPREILNHDGQFVAHNWFFEWSFFNQFYPKSNAADYRRWICTAALARWHNIASPQSKLEQVARALHVEQKDKAGADYVSKYCVPKDGEFLRVAPKDEKGFVAYCRQDVVVSRDIYNALAPHFDDWAAWEAAKAIEVRGVPVDTKGAAQLVERLKVEKEKATKTAERLAGRTKGGALVLSSHTAFKNFLEVKFGISLPNTRAETIAACAANYTQFSVKTEAEMNDIPLGKKGSIQTLSKMKQRQLVEILAIRTLLVGRSSDKARAILDRAHKGRVYGGIVFHAAHTGRFQSWGVNWFNFPRECAQDWEAEKDSAPIATLQRGVVCASKGRQLVESDWRGIENYLSLYFAGDTAQRVRIEAGESPYLIFAEKVYGRKVAKSETVAYTHAKSSVLGFGYAAGAPRFVQFCAQMGVAMDLQQAERLKNAWRSANAPIVRLWKILQNAFIMARSGREVDVRNVYGRRLGLVFSPIKNGVTLRLPDGHLLWYRNVALKPSEYGAEIVHDGQRLHGGLLLENVAQGVCARLLNRALPACEKAGLEVVLHVYDSIVIESRAPKRDAATLAAIMTSAPEWAPDLKLAVDLKIGKRWTK